VAFEQSGKKESTRLRGFGGSTEVEVVSQFEFKFRARDFAFVQRPAQVLPQDPSVDRDCCHVWSGKTPRLCPKLCRDHPGTTGAADSILD